MNFADTGRNHDLDIGLTLGVASGYACGCAEYRSRRFHLGPAQIREFRMGTSYTDELQQ